MSASSTGGYRVGQVPSAEAGIDMPEAGMSASAAAEVTVPTGSGEMSLPSMSSDLPIAQGAGDVTISMPSGGKPGKNLKFITSD